MPSTETADAATESVRARMGSAERTDRIITNMADIKNWIYGAWIVGLAFWALASIASTRRRGQGYRARALWIGEWRPTLRLFAYAGPALTIAGLGFMAWSRVALGRNWSATVTIKQDHALVISGPYAIVRHPLYAGVLLAMLGTAIFFGQIRGFIAFCLTFGGWWLKSRTEEGFMVEHFGAPYRRYQGRVKALIPYVL